MCSSRCILRALFLYNTCVPVCFFQRQQTKTLDLIHPDCEVCRMSLLNFLAEAITATLQLPVTELRFKPTAHTTVALVSWICFMFWTNSKQVITFLFFFFIYLTWPVVSVWQQLTFECLKNQENDFQKMLKWFAILMLRNLLAGGWRAENYLNLMTQRRKYKKRQKIKCWDFFFFFSLSLFFFNIKVLLPGGSFSVPCDGPKRGEEQQMFILSDIRNKTWLWANKFKWNDIEVVKWLPWKDLFTITCAEKVSRGYTAQRSYSINLQSGCKHYQWPELLFCSY